MSAFLTMLLAWLQLGIFGGEAPRPAQNHGGPLSPVAHAPTPAPPNNQGAAASPIYNGI